MQGSAQETNTTPNGSIPPVQAAEAEPSPQAAVAPKPKRKRTRKARPKT
jgi:hypothetical protein